MTVELSGRLAESIRRHALTARPEEACGILVGRVAAGRVRVRHALPCANAAHPDDRRRRFEIEPRAVLDVQRALRRTPHALVGFYHSHPETPPTPSSSDLEYLRLWPETVWVIAGPERAGEIRLRAWWLPAGEGGVARELGIVAPAAPAAPVLRGGQTPGGATGGGTAGATSGAPAAAARSRGVRPLPRPE